MVPDPENRKFKHSKAFLLTAERSLRRGRLTQHMSHMASEKPDGQAVRSVTRHAGAMRSETFQAPLKRQPLKCFHSNDIIFIGWQYFKLLFTVCGKTPDNCFISPHCSPRSVDMHFNKVTHFANEYLQLLEIKCTPGFVVRVYAVIRENSCWNSARSLKATN